MKAKIKTRPQKSSAVGKTRQSRARSDGKGRTEFKSILVPVDFSDTSIRALDYAVALAAKSGAKLRLIHILEFPAVFNSTAQPSYAAWDRGAQQSATDRLAELLGKKVDRSIKASSEVHIGRAYKTICEVAKDRKVDLIIMGTHGFTGLKHLFLGSTAERVIRHAPCSVMAIRTQKSRTSKLGVSPKRILVPTDFSKPAEEALKSAVALARQYQARMHLLYVIPIHYAVGDYDMMDLAVLAAEQKEEGQKMLGAMSRKLSAQDIAVDTEIRHGRPAVEINEAASALDAGLIVISTHGYTGWQRAVLGSTAEEVVRHSLSPVLIVRNK